MVELTSRDRLQPSLLDRLLDNDRHHRKEPAEARVLSRAQLRAAVLRDLTWLFNATRPEPEPKSDQVDELRMWRQAESARRSVLNYGMPAFAGVTLASMDTEAMKRSVAEAIRLFEPRIDSTTLEVDLRVDGDDHHNTMHLTIRGQMWGQPVPLELLLAADIDVETGNTRIRDLRN